MVANSEYICAFSRDSAGLRIFHCTWEPNFWLQPNRGKGEAYSKLVLGNSTRQREATPSPAFPNNIFWKLTSYWVCKNLLYFLGFKNMSEAKAVLSIAASLAASAMLIGSIANDFLPTEVQDYWYSSLHFVSQYLSSRITIVIKEFLGLIINQVFEATHLYLGDRTTTSSAKRLRVGKSEKEKTFRTTLDRNEEMVDVFEDVTLKWKLICTQVPLSVEYINPDLEDHNASLRSEVRHYELSFHKKHTDTVLNLYLPHVLKKAKAVKEDCNTVKLYTVLRNCWDANNVVLKHAMTFKDLALDSELKKMIIKDLDIFRNGKEYYRRVGRVWKRGYLLFGPPGTGKSNLIAFMANHLKFDIYHLDLTDIQFSSDLQFLLLTMPSRSR